MHRLNPFRSNVDFRAIASAYPPLGPLCAGAAIGDVALTAGSLSTGPDGQAVLDFSDQQAVR